MSAPSTLDALGSGQTARVREVGLEGDAARLLDALGIVPGAQVTLLRRGILGGPLHVRIARGAEIALSPELAAGVSVDGEGS